VQIKIKAKERERLPPMDLQRKNPAAGNGPPNPQHTPMESSNRELEGRSGWPEERRKDLRREVSGCSWGKVKYRDAVYTAVKIDGRSERDVKISGARSEFKKSKHNLTQISGPDPIIEDGTNVCVSRF
jgi:hypothetical protein